MSTTKTPGKSVRLDSKAGGPPPAWNNWIFDKASDVSAQVTIDNSRSPIARSGYSIIYLGTYSNKGQVAVKRLLVEPKEYSTQSWKVIRDEVDACFRLKHEHLLEFFGTCFLDNNLHLVSVYALSGNVLDYTKSNPNVDRVRLLTETAGAIAYLHSKKIIHEDIKANNILIGSNEEAKICDFGLRTLQATQTVTGLRQAGNLRWRAPELFENLPKTYQTDVYAYGITIAEVLKGAVPFGELSESAFMKAFYGGQRPTADPAMSPTRASYDLLWDIARRCWCAAPEERISMNEAFDALSQKQTSKSAPNKLRGRIRRKASASQSSSRSPSPQKWWKYLGCC